MRELAITIAAAAGAAFAAVGLVIVATPAAATHAQGQPIYITMPTTGYTSPSNGSAAMLTGLQPGQAVTAYCFTEGQTLNGSHYWFRVGTTPEPNGNTAFVNRTAISTAPTSLPHC